MMEPAMIKKGMASRGKDWVAVTNFCRSREAVRKWGYIMTFGMWCGAPDILSRPDFISSKFRDRRNLIMRLRHRLGVKQVNWTIKNHRQMANVDKEGGLSIFERFMPR